ncbi:MAG: hypothetical protein RL654_844 [Pseudomonadota bacterium]
MSRAAAWLPLALLLLAPPVRADWLQPCAAAPDPGPRAIGRMLMLAERVRTELEASGRRIALVSRAGLDLDRIGHRFSHAGFSVRASADGPWSVRQLYYACEEGRSRLFDQGLAGFLAGAERPERGHLSVLLLPLEARADEAALEAALLDASRSLEVLGAVYSPNAHAFSTRYQNCNQWAAELIAIAGGAAPGREAAQVWLRRAGYQPSRIELPLWAVDLTRLVPWLHHDDHPPEDLAAGHMQVSLPAALEDFMRQRWPAAERLQFCHAGARGVLRRGGAPLSDDCVADARAGDEVFALE